MTTVKGGKVWYVTAAVVSEKAVTASQVGEVLSNAYLEGMVIADVTVREGVVLPQPEPRTGGEDSTKAVD